ncbi:MAG: hypothetical protein ACYDHE_08260 [Candidatus Acidiferrales bacterium]
MKTAKFTKLERRVGHIASRRASRQLMQVPWDRFHKAYEEYIRWQAFVLWARAVVELEGSAPSWLEAILRKRCPGFVKQVARSNKPELLGLQLLPWVHNQVFGFAKEEGWHDALVFYGFRDARSQGYWTYWEHCESEWRKRRPASFPAFVQWMRSALNRKLHGDVSCAVVAKAVEKFIDFEALVYWLRPLYRGAKVQLPPHVALELKQESPSLLEFVSRETLAAYEDKSRSWQSLFNWGKDHVLSQAKKEGWLKFVLRQASIHPCHVRMAGYAHLWCRSQAENPTSPHPPFREWRRDAESYVRTSRK